jgi:hypothetical protein
MPPKFALRECAMDGSETATMFESRLIMKDGIETQSRTRTLCNLSGVVTSALRFIGSVLAFMGVIWTIFPDSTFVVAVSGGKHLEATVLLQRREIGLYP